mmetsp:Transcript_24760/g.46231  ORF Transcript_24760/g.46231 Transcript_24760/m.46231 type:complete len:122 (-) Transcript_24760:696-1061(-)
MTADANKTDPMRMKGRDTWEAFLQYSNCLCPYSLAATKDIVPSCDKTVNDKVSLDPSVESVNKSSSIAVWSKISGESKSLSYVLLIGKFFDLLRNDWGRTRWEKLDILFEKEEKTLFLDSG